MHILLDAPNHSMDAYLKGYYLGVGNKNVHISLARGCSFREVPFRRSKPTHFSSKDSIVHPVGDSQVMYYKDLVPRKSQ